MIDPNGAWQATEPPSAAPHGPVDLSPVSPEETSIVRGYFTWEFGPRWFFTHTIQLGNEDGSARVVVPSDSSRRQMSVRRKVERDVLRA